MARRGRPPKNMIVPHPLKPDEWLQIGGYDKTWRAANRYWTLVREGTPPPEALKRAAEECRVQPSSLVDWLDRARKRGPIDLGDEGWEGDPDN